MPMKVYDVAVDQDQKRGYSTPGKPAMPLAAPTGPRMRGQERAKAPKPIAAGKDYAPDPSRRNRRSFGVGYGDQ